MLTCCGWAAANAVIAPIDNTDAAYASNNSVSRPALDISNAGAHSPVVSMSPELLRSTLQVQELKQIPIYSVTSVSRAHKIRPNSTYPSSNTKITELKDESGNPLKLLQTKTRSSFAGFLLNYSSRHVVSDDFLGSGHSVRARDAFEFSGNQLSRVAILTVGLTPLNSGPLKLCSHRDGHALQHEFIEEKKGFFGTSYSRFRMVMPCYQPLSNYEPKSVAHASKIGLDVLTALSHLHENRIIHGDVKPDNIMCEPDGMPRMNDFDFSLDYSFLPNEASKVYLGGTRMYTAPELQVGAYTNIRVSFKEAEEAERFSVGLTLYYLFAYQERYERDRLPKQNYGFQIPSYFSDTQKNVVLGLTKSYPSRRMSIQDAICFLSQEVSGSTGV